MLGFGALGELALGEVTLASAEVSLPGGSSRRKRRRGLPFRVPSQQPAEAPRPKPQVPKQEPVEAPRLPGPIKAYYGELWRPIDGPAPPWRAEVQPAPQPPATLRADIEAQAYQQAQTAAAGDMQDATDAMEVLDVMDALAAIEMLLQGDGNA